MNKGEIEETVHKQAENLGHTMSNAQHEAYLEMHRLSQKVGQKLHTVTHDHSEKPHSGAHEKAGVHEHPHHKSASEVISNVWSTVKSTGTRPHEAGRR